MTTSQHIAHVLLSKAHPPEKAYIIFVEKILQKPLHLRPTSPDPTSQNARATRRLQRLRKKELSARRQKPKPLSAKEKRISGIYEIAKHAQKYEVYLPLHSMWLCYMWEILGLEKGEKAFVTAQSVGTKLASADFHGAELVVVRSRCVSMVGLKGIVVRDTKYTFVIVTKKNELKTIPKKHTVFRFEISRLNEKAIGSPDISDGKQSGEGTLTQKNLVFELHGSQFENRATDRATKKFKQRNMSDL